MLGCPTEQASVALGWGGWGLRPAVDESYWGLTGPRTGATRQLGRCRGGAKTVRGPSKNIWLMYLYLNFLIQKKMETLKVLEEENEPRTPNSVKAQRIQNNLTLRRTAERKEYSSNNFS